ncbi:TsoY family (seleno)protein [Pararhodobacter sp.]|uniref:TsoY family (seleno)protein n=1 Tax=Pararhodobacter sp. TaxID=2127056 RepID=UPI002FDED529
MSLTSRPSDNYAPLYFLASLGAGGLSVTFFMWLMHWIPHPGRTVPVFEDIAAAFSSGSVLTQGMIVLAMAAIAFFAFLNIRSLIWNLGRYSAWRKSDAYAKFAQTNAQSQIMALPLALGMTVNAAFILGLVFVPGLWSVIEYLFPLAIIAFVAIGVLAFRLYAEFLGRVLTEGGLNMAANNNFGQILPAFAFAMTGVGLAAPAALSSVQATAAIGLMLSGFFFITALVIAAVALVLGVRSMLENGVGVETAPTLMILIPITTILGILLLRQEHGLGEHFAAHAEAAGTMMMLTQMIAFQVLFGILGFFVLARLGYAKRFLFGRDNSAGAYALVCPGVGFAVLMQFWINKGLVGAGLLDKFSAPYWALTAIALISQFAMVWLVFHLNRRHFGAARAAAAVPAE